MGPRCDPSRRGASRAEGRDAGGGSPGLPGTPDLIRGTEDRGYPRLGQSPCPGAVRCVVGFAFFEAYRRLPEE
jgi:hypothetical protein